MLRRLSMAAFAASFLFAGVAEAQVYKYRKKDGSVSYTDSLAQLPADRRAYYNKREKEREEQQRILEKAHGKQSVEAEAMEQERKRVLMAKIQEEERQRRLTEIDKQLVEIRARRAKTTATRGEWKARIDAAKKKLSESLAAFEAAQKSYNSVAIKGGYGLLPGQADQMKKDKAKMDELEVEIDAANLELTDTIPNDARRAGVPPGWLR